MGNAGGLHFRISTRARNNPKMLLHLNDCSHILLFLFDTLHFFFYFRPFSKFLASVSNFGLVKINILDWTFVIIVCGVVSTSSNPPRGGVLPIMAYTERLRPKGVPFSGFRYIKG